MGMVDSVYHIDNRKSIGYTTKSIDELRQIVLPMFRTENHVTSWYCSRDFVVSSVRQPVILN